MPNKYAPSLLAFARAVSAVFNPLTALFAFFAYYNARHSSWAQAMHYFWPIFLITVLPTAAWIFWHVRRGSYTNTDVSDRNQRKTLYFFIEAVLAAYLAYFYLQNQRVDWMMFCVFALLLLMQASNYFIKSSMHTAFNLLAAAFFFSENFYIGILWLLITALVAASRIVLGRHSLREVLSGTAIAAVVSFLYLYLNIQFNHQ